MLKENGIFQPAAFRGYVSFQGGEGNLIQWLNEYMCKVEPVTSRRNLLEDILQRLTKKRLQ